jgi:hypothetical protein
VKLPIPIAPAAKAIDKFRTCNWILLNAEFALFAPFVKPDVIKFKATANDKFLAIFYSLAFLRISSSLSLYSSAIAFDLVASSSFSQLNKMSSLGDFSFFPMCGRIE